MSEEPSLSWAGQIEAVYKEQSRELWALFYAHCGNPERAYDALQESFLRLQQQNGTQIHDVRAWLLQVGRNWLRDVARRKVNSVKLTDRLDHMSGPPTPSAAGLVHAELRGHVREALKNLKEEDREVLILRYALGWSSIRIAETIGSTQAAVDMRLSRARRRMAVELERLGVTHEFI